MCWILRKDYRKRVVLYSDASTQERTWNHDKEDGNRDRRVKKWNVKKWWKLIEAEEANRVPVRILEIFRGKQTGKKYQESDLDQWK